MRRMTKQEAARAALAMQNVCNAAGVAGSVQQIAAAFLDRGTDAANRAAPVALAVHQLAWLTTGSNLLDLDTYSRTVEACESIAAATDEELIPE